jgi:O-succinylbenzoic acid--CoA ligase
LKTTSHSIHPAFKLNGLDFESRYELLVFAQELKDEGAKHEISLGNFIIKWLNESDEIIVKTSGSTGKPKKIKVKKEHMMNSAKATGVYFKMGEGSRALLCLPTKYIAGKMMVVRAMILGWDLHVVAPEKDALTQYDNTYDFAALVPYQVYHSFKALSKVKRLLIGGGPVPDSLETKLQNSPTEAFATYGMTETITHVAVRRLNGAGATPIFSALPDIKFSLDDRGCLVITAPKITDDIVVTNDLVTLNSPTSFVWIGRYDNVINSGGIKIFPEKVENKLSEFITRPFIISSEKDEALGSRLILVIENPNQEPLSNFSEAFNSLLPHEKPKKIYTVSKFPYTKTGKIKRKDVFKLFQKK